MWVNKQYEVAESIRWLEEFIEENTLSTIISHSPLRVAHMPVELARGDESDRPRLLFHLPIVDPIAAALSEQGDVTVVVHGPQQYISPTLYSDLGLPTFNYGIAEISGRCRQLSSAELGDHLQRLMREREELFSRRTGHLPWQIDEAAQQRFDKLLPMVAGFELDLERAQVKLKMGQNRSSEDRADTIDRLRSTRGVDGRVTEIMDSLL